MLNAKALFTKAEPLFRRMAAIFYRSQQTAGHTHPYMQSNLENYRHLLSALDVPPDDIEQWLQTATQTPGPLNPITPEEVERLLGPAQPVQMMLNALDEQYRREHKPAVWFLPLTEPIAPHLEALLGPSQLDLPLDQPVSGSPPGKTPRPGPVNARRAQRPGPAISRARKTPSLVPATRGAYFPSP